MNRNLDAYKKLMAAWRELERAKRACERSERFYQGRCWMEGSLLHRLSLHMQIAISEELYKCRLQRLINSNHFKYFHAESEGLIWTWSEGFDKVSKRYEELSRSGVTGVERIALLAGTAGIVVYEATHKAHFIALVLFGILAWIFTMVHPDKKESTGDLHMKPEHGSSAHKHHKVKPTHLGLRLVYAG
jgi:hypothetical protein